MITGRGVYRLNRFANIKTIKTVTACKLAERCAISTDENTARISFGVWFSSSILRSRGDRIE